MDPSTLAELIAEYGSPSDIAASLALDEAGRIDDLLLPVRDLRRFQLTPEATEAASAIAFHLVTAQRLMATLPALLAPAGEAS